MLKIDEIEWERVVQFGNIFKPTYNKDGTFRTQYPQCWIKYRDEEAMEVEGTISELKKLSPGYEKMAKEEVHWVTNRGNEYKAYAWTLRVVEQGVHTLDEDARSRAHYALRHHTMFTLIEDDTDPWYYVTGGFFKRQSDNQFYYYDDVRGVLVETGIEPDINGGTRARLEEWQKRYLKSQGREVEKEAG